MTTPEALATLRALYERVQMDESVGICLSSRVEALNFPAALALLEQRLAELEKERDENYMLDVTTEDTWVPTYEKVEPHPLCCAECRANLERIAAYERVVEAAERAQHELDQWVFADGTAAYRVERAEKIIDAALAALKEQA